MEYRGYEVNFVQNFTDIDDKMINKANEEHTTVKEIGDKYIDEYYKDADGLNIKRATTNPRATEYISEIILFNLLFVSLRMNVLLCCSISFSF